MVVVMMVVMPAGCERYSSRAGLVYGMIAFSRGAKQLSRAGGWMDGWMGDDGFMFYGLLAKIEKEDARTVCNDTG